MIKVYVVASKRGTLYERRELSKFRAGLQKRDRYGRFAKAAPKVSSIKKNPLVTFFYPMSETPWNSSKRTVRLISSNGSHFTGLEAQRNGKWKYKKYLTPKATEFSVTSFNPESMS